MHKIVFAMMLAVLAYIAGCRTAPQAKQYDRPLPPGELALVKIENPADIPDFTDGSYNLANLRDSINNSLNYLKKPSSRQFFPYGDITHDRAVESLKAFGKLIDSGLRGQELNDAIGEYFDVYMSVGCDRQGTVLFTGYYTPIFEGSPTTTEKFQFPLYSQPEDLVKGANGEILGRQDTDGTITPYPPRAEIEKSDLLQGKELIWLGDPFEVYIAQVQGSAKVRMPDEKLTTVGYAASNGQEYQSIAKELVKDGAIPAEKMSLSTMISYFKEHPDLVSAYIQRNPRYIFFRKKQGPPRGSINEPVIAMRTIATDKSVFPRACLTYISTTLPRLINGQLYHDAYGGFALDQDTGGAIRAAGRCDVYMGEGDKAGQLAGHTYREGRLYYLFLKPFYKDSHIMPEHAGATEPSKAYASGG
ncbi:MAG: MltA domain-containing protein [Sedimentisphaerales bacterium]|nr:MltA domain-containing protein [Sedimentisphaerales bacterium]